MSQQDKLQRRRIPAPVQRAKQVQDIHRARADFNVFRTIGHGEMDREYAEPWTRYGPPRR